MKTMHIALALSLAAVASMAVAAPTGTALAGQTAAATGSTAPGGKIKCTRESITGSNRTVRLCLTEEQARTITTEEKVDLIRSQLNGTAGRDD